MVERIALAAKAAAVWRRNHTNVTCRQSKDFRKRTMNVVRRLSRTPERDLSVRIEVRDRGVLLQRQGRVAFVEESVLTNEIRLNKTLLNNAEPQRNFLFNFFAVA